MRARDGGHVWCAAIGPDRRLAKPNTHRSRVTPLPLTDHQAEDTRHPTTYTHDLRVRARRLAYAPLQLTRPRARVCERNLTGGDHGGDRRGDRARYTDASELISVFLLKPRRQRCKQGSKRNILLYVYTRRKNTSFLSLLFRERSLTTIAQTPPLAKPVQPHTATHTQHVTNTIYNIHVYSILLCRPRSARTTLLRATALQRTFVGYKTNSVLAAPLATTSSSSAARA